MLLVAANTPTKWAIELKEIRERLRLKQREMAESLGVPFDRYRNYEYRNPPSKVLDNAREMVAKESSGFYSLKPRPTGKLRVLGSIGAGDAPDYEPDDHWIFVPIEYVREDFGAISIMPDGFSMLPYLHPGDILIFKRTDVPKLGKIIAVRLPGEVLPVAKKCVLKDGKPTLHSFNEDYPDIPIDGARILGYLTGIVAGDGSLRLGPEEAGIDERFIDSQLRARLT